MAKVKCNCKPGLPPWMATFSDLMSLLMCFFVLLLSFSEMDVMKFKQIAGSMKYAFGVQNKIEVKDIPKGTSVIAQEFRPGRPIPTPIETINQQTAEMTQTTLDFQAGDDSDSGGSQQQNGTQIGGQNSVNDIDTEKAEQIESSSSPSSEQVSKEAKKIAMKLEKEIKDGAIEVESLGQQINIRIREKGSFASGSAFLQPRLKPTIQAIGELISDIPGIVTVTGYTDDGNIKNELYSSNWDLSSKRAVAVAEELTRVNSFDERRLKVIGLSSNNPLVPNNSEKNRAKNRRVEISIVQGKAKDSDEISSQKQIEDNFVPKSNPLQPANIQ